jgi:hypothetical protein
MRPRRPEAALLTALLAALLPAQAPAPFTAPDGTRFLLAPDPSAVAVHWAVASPSDAAHDPPSHEGLSLTLVQTSLLGTWHTGSRDHEREHEALMWLDEAWQRMLRDPRDATAADDVKRWDEQARELADPRAFLRRIAAAPAWRPEVQSIGPTTVLTLSTTRAGIAAVAAMLVERREDQAMRDLPRTWLRTLEERNRVHAGDPHRAMRAELVALTLAGTPAERAARLPDPALPPRDVAAATWALTQHPSATVHVLLGDFDLAATRATLARTFAATLLPLPPQTPGIAPQPLAGVRRSSVRGVATPAVAVGWLLPLLANGDTLAAACGWLADGDDGALVRRLRQTRGNDCRVTVSAPWPELAGETTLLVVEAADPKGLAGLADDVLAACRDLAASPPPAAELDTAHRARLRRWLAGNRDPRAQAAAVAAQAVAWPKQPASLAAPATPTPAAVHELLRTVLTRQAAVVEGTP